MTDFIKVSKTQADDLLRNAGRTFWSLSAKQEVGDTSLPTLWFTLTAEDVHEVVEASNERRYGNIKCYRSYDEPFEKQRLEIKVGKVWYRLNLDGSQ